MSVGEFLAGFKNISLGSAGIAIIIGIVWGLYAYLGPIKYNTDLLVDVLPTIERSLLTIEKSLVAMEKDTKLIPDMKESVNFLNAKATVRMGKDGGELRSLDWRTTIIIPPGSISETTYLTYMPVSIRDLAAKPPREFELLSYSFSITPLDITGAELSNFFLKKYAELYIAYKSIDSLKDIREPENIVLLNWEQRKGEWSPIKTTLKGNTLYAKITHFTLFTLALRIQEKAGS